MVYLNEQKVATLQHTTYLADEFALTHTSVFTKCDSPTRSVALKPPTYVPVTWASVPQLAGNIQQLCFFHKPDHLVAEYESLKHSASFKVAQRCWTH